MEAGEQLKDLNMTADEVDKFKKAFKDEKFREMLQDYAQEISDPENKKRYEEEIQLLEQERGNTVEFIHPEPFRAFRTSVDGKKRCYVNICGSDKVGKPEWKSAASDGGQRGRCWLLPHSLHPGRYDTDGKGNKIVIYDVVFHPDTLHIAGKDRRFMDMVKSTAIQGIQDGFKVTVDKNNVKEVRAKYKGIPQPCVIRKPIPGYKAKEASKQPDPLAFPYPDEKRPATRAGESPSTKNKTKPQSLQIQQTKEPTKPNYKVKYRSFIDLQDYRCSRDSGRSPRPKEIVITVDLPLLKSVTDASLEVKDKMLLLESQIPAYRLELPLAYPVDEDKGEAKFDKQRRQLIVTLPVLPPNAECGLFAGPVVSGSDGEGQESGAEETEEETKSEEQGLDDEVQFEKCAEEEETSQEKGKEWMMECEKSVQGGVEEENGKQLDRKSKEHVDEKEDGAQKSDTSPESGVKGVENRLMASPDTENSSTEFIWNTSENEDINPVSILESTPKMNHSDILELTEETRETAQGNIQVGNNGHFQSPDPSGESQDLESEATAAASFPSAVLTIANRKQREEDPCTSDLCETSRQIPATDGAGESSMVGSGDMDSEEPATQSEPPEKAEDIDNLPGNRTTQTSKREIKPAAGLLREIDEEGHETFITDHSTSAGFLFQNTLIFDLD